MLTVDDLDKRILNEYQKDASISYQVLAERLGTPPTSTVFSRIKRMKDTGIITGIIPVVNASALGKTTTAWIRVELDSATDCCELADQMALWREILEVHEMAGDWDLLLKVKVENNLALHDLTKELGKIPGVSKISSLVAFRTVKEDPRIPISLNDDVESEKPSS